MLALYKEVKFLLSLWFASTSVNKVENFQMSGRGRHTLSFEVFFMFRVRRCFFSTVMSLFRNKTNTFKCFVLPENCPENLRLLPPRHILSENCRTWHCPTTLDTLSTTTWTSIYKDESDLSFFVLHGTAQNLYFFFNSLCSLFAILSNYPLADVTHFSMYGGSKLSISCLTFSSLVRISNFTFEVKWSVFWWM